MAVWWASVTNVQGNGKHWRHTCCNGHLQCWRDEIKEANQHADERAAHQGVRQHVRWSTRRKTWVIEAGA